MNYALPGAYPNIRGSPIQTFVKLFQKIEKKISSQPENFFFQPPVLFKSSPPQLVIAYRYKRI